MKGTFRLASLVVAVAIAGCGGGGGSSGGGTPPATPKSSVAGAVTKGPVAGATLYLYSMDAAGQKTGDSVAGPIVTELDGSWSVQVPDSVPRPLLIESSGGTYTDEATGGEVTAGSLNSFLPEGAETAAVTPLSELLVRATREHLLDNAGASLDEGLDAGLDVLDNVLGVSFDPLTTVPSTTGDDEAAKQYAAVLGGLSTQAKNVSAGTDPFETVLALVDDASDGVVDGKKDGADIVLGDATLPATSSDDLVDAIGEYTANPDNGDFDGVTSFKVMATSDANGRVSPTSLSLLGGASASFTITPDTGYSIDAVNGCEGDLSGSRFTTDALQTACTLSVSFAINEYEVTAASVTGGAILPVSAFVDHGDSTQFEVAADEGYDLVGVSGCDGSLTGSTYTTGAITASCTLTPSFALKQYAVTTSVTAGNGRFDPTSLTVSHGQSDTLTVTAGMGSMINTVDGDSCEVAAGQNPGEYTVGPVTSDCTVSASFSLQQFMVSTAVTGNGMVSPGSATVEYGSATSFNVIADPNHQVASAMGCGGALSEDLFTTAMITGNCSVAVVFEPVSYTVTTLADHGSFSPANPSVEYNQAQAFTVTPEEGYEVVSIAGCGGVQDGNSFTTGAITAECSVTATFAEKTYTLTATVSGSNGMIGPNTVEDVVHGSRERFTVTPEEGYVVSAISGCEGSLEGNTYTTGAITDDCAITVSFVEDGSGPVAAVWDQFIWDQANWQ